MKLTESIDPKGRLTIEMRDIGGNLIGEVSANNSIVLSGRDIVAQRFVLGGVPPISCVAVGTGSTAVDPDLDTALEAELFRKLNKPINPSQDFVTTIDGKRKVTISCDLDFSEANGAITEAALFNDINISDGVMYNRVVFPAVNKTIAFKLTLVWEITF